MILSFKASSSGSNVIESKNKPFICAASKSAIFNNSEIIVYSSNNAVITAKDSSNNTVCYIRFNCWFYFWFYFR